MTLQPAQRTEYPCFISMTRKGRKHSERRSSGNIDRLSEAFCGMEVSGRCNPSGQFKKLPKTRSVITSWTQMSAAAFPHGFAMILANVTVIFGESIRGIVSRFLLQGEIEICCPTMKKLSVGIWLHLSRMGW